MRHSIRILLIEDTYLTRLGTRTLLETQQDFEVVGEAADGAAAVASWKALQPDVAVVDLRLPTLTGVQVISAIRKQAPAARLIVLSQYDSPDEVVSALKAGALGYVTKGTLGEELIAAIRAAARGEKYLPGPVASRVAEHVTSEPLSHRERHILEYMVKGLTNGEIAEKLALAEKTIAAHITSILQKLQARSRTEAAAIAIRRRLVSGDSD